MFEILFAMFGATKFFFLFDASEFSNRSSALNLWLSSRLTSMLGTLASGLKQSLKTKASRSSRLCRSDSHPGSRIAKKHYATSSAPVRTVSSVIADKATLGQKVTVQGWVRSVRDQKSNTFVDVNDGSCLSNIQVCLSSEQATKYDPQPSIPTIPS